MANSQDEDHNKPDKEFDDEQLEGFDPARREVLRRLLLGAVFVVPIVSSFSIDRLLINPARAQGTLQPTGALANVNKWFCFDSAGYADKSVTAIDRFDAQKKCGFAFDPRRGLPGGDKPPAP